MLTARVEAYSDPRVRYGIGMTGKSLHIFALPAIVGTKATGFMLGYFIGTSFEFG